MPLRDTATKKKNEIKNTYSLILCYEIQDNKTLF